ncbi:MAG TPA: uracil phosphoribosyltransferase [Balneolales bacterium]|nr:uracil phosphoribosyltransferase [Balneolales bacterium]
MHYQKNNIKNLKVVKHPLTERDLTILRDKNTSSSMFRQVLGRVSMILAYHALEDLPLKQVTLNTPIQKTEGVVLDTDIIVVPILRAGLGLVDSIITFIPETKVGHLGLYRDETTKQPVEYYYKMPDGLDTAEVILVDPMLATAGSAIAALNILKEHGAKKIRFMCLIAAPEGIEKLQQEHPDVPIVTAAVDEKLNEDAYIVPGLGDAGDRFFGTV